jgi:IS1 family transposase
VSEWRVKVLAYVFGRWKDEDFLRLKALLEPFGITRYYTDGWGTYERQVDAEKHTVGKEHMQRIESKHITLRTRIKRLVRRTICFSKTERMHDLVIGLFVNRYEFERGISREIHNSETPSKDARLPSACIRHHALRVEIADTATLGAGLLVNHGVH